jgi:hypothetical protein
VSSSVPKDIREFAVRCFPSIEHLETFMLLRQNTTKSWNARDIAAELGIAEAAAAHPGNG